jgi:hypothetical protein
MFISYWIETQTSIFRNSDDAFAVGKKFPIALSLLASADSISS